MKKTLFLSLVSSFISLSIVAQNEWNSMNNAGNPMYRKGNVAIGTPGPNPAVHFVVQDPGGSGTKVSLGNNGIVGGYLATESVMELTSPTLADAALFAMNTGPVANRSSLTFGISTAWGAGIYSTAGGGGVVQPLNFYVGTQAMRIEPNGKVSIGTPVGGTPGTYKLYVQTGILTEKVKVAVDGTAQWADHVFAPSYKLRPLEEVESFINKNKHLPGIPSAEEVVKEGVDLGAMDARLLEKIEELTLYVIDLKKDMEKMKKENEALKAEIEKK
jgi:hypothetical protein